MATTKVSVAESSNVGMSLEDTYTEVRVRVWRADRTLLAKGKRGRRRFVKTGTHAHKCTFTFHRRGCCYDSRGSCFNPLLRCFNSV